MLLGKVLGDESRIKASVKFDSVHIQVGAVECFSGCRASTDNDIAPKDSVTGRREIVISNLILHHFQLG